MALEKRMKKAKERSDVYRGKEMAEQARIKAEAAAAAQRTAEEIEMIQAARGEAMARVSKFDDGSPCWPGAANQSILMDDRVINEIVLEMATTNIGPDHRPSRRPLKRRVYYAIFAGTLYICTSCLHACMVLTIHMPYRFQSLECMFSCAYKVVCLTVISFSHGVSYWPITTGRRHFMRVHLKFTDALLRQALVNEVHLWDFCNVIEDSEFLAAFSRNSALDGYHLFRRPMSDNNKFAKSVNTGYLWGSFYSHYQSNPRYRDSYIFIKADDDIVFLDLRHFAQFLRGVTKEHVHFPNIVNNDAGEDIIRGTC